MNISRRAIHYAALGVMSVVIVYAFVLIGSPQQNRDRLQDKTTLAELNQIHCHINNYFQQNKKPPATLEVLKDTKVNARSSDGNWSYCKPITDELELTSKTYTPQETGYSICADFLSQWSELEQRPYDTQYETYRDFKPGNNCFERKLTEFKKRAL